MIGIYRGLVVDAFTIARAPAVGLWVVEANTRGPFADASRIPGDIREAVARIADVAAAGSITYQTVETEHQANKLRLYVIGYELTRPGGPPEIVEGREIARNHYELVADRTTGLVLGDRIQLGRNIFTVVGLTRHQVNSGGRSCRLHHTCRRAEAAVRPRSARRPPPASSWHAAPAVAAGISSMPSWPGCTPTRSGGLVGENDARAVRQRASDGHAAARKIIFDIHNESGADRKIDEAER
jgi:hypothetical protein